MNSNDFLEWLGGQLESMILLPDGDQRLLVGREIVLDAFRSLDNMPLEERHSALSSLRNPSSRMIGRFEPPYGESGDEDWLDGILATIVGHYE